jgi:hypothetical protein
VKYTKTVHIDAKPSQIWPVLTDFKRWPTWTDSMKEVIRVSSGETGVGTKIRLRQPKGRAMIWTITDFTEDTSFTWAASTPGATYTATHDIAESDGGSQVVLAFEVAGPLAALASLTAGKRIRSYVDMEAAGLKKRVEANP